MKCVFRTMVVSLAVLLLGSLSTVSAGFYGGASLGQGSADVSLTDFNDGSLTGTVDDSAMSWRVFGGFKMFKFFAVEAAVVDMGEVSTDAMSDGTGAFFASGPVTATQSVDGYSVSGVGALPVGSNFQLFARLGYLFWDAEMTMSNGAFPGGSLTATDDGNDMEYGAGMVWNYTGPGALRVEYEVTKVAEIDVNSLSAGLSFRF